jgi:hypothetical protein
LALKRAIWAFGLAVVLSANAFAQEFSITAVVRKSGLSWEEAAAVLLLAKVLGIDMTMIVTTRKETSTPIFVLAPAVVIAKVSKKDLREIVKMRGKGHGWGVIAHRLGVHPGAFNQQRVILSKLSDEDLVASVWLSVLSQAFGIPTGQIAKFRQEGLEWGDVIALLQVSAASKTEPEKVLARWREMGRDWSRVRAHFGVSPDWLPQIEVRESKQERATSPKGRGKGLGKQKH